METLALLWVWFVHCAIASILSTPIVYLGRGRVNWTRRDLLVFILPFGVWLGLFLSPASTGKSLGNLAEPIDFSFAIPVAALLRVVLATHVPERACSMILVALLTFTAILVFWLMPPLPE